MKEFDSIEILANEIRLKLEAPTNKKNICLIYAFNGTGKTRLSKILSGIFEEKTLTYDVFFEDLFTWNNEEFVLNFSSYSRIISFIKDQGLENQITENFQRLTGPRIEPVFYFEEGKVSFNYVPGDERSENNIKISRGEERLFIWSIFYTVLDAIISILNVPEENRESGEFNDLEYIIIDDPVSSVDETRVITMAIELINVVNTFPNSRFKFLITTHHPLFYNIIFNEYNRNSRFKFYPLLLSKNLNGLLLETQNDSPFGYHLVVKDIIQNAVTSNDIEKYHFNLFRALLEKTASFLGYKNWYDCLEGTNKKEITKLVNLHSHGKLSELEIKSLPDEQKEIFTDVFNGFITNFRWKV